MAEPEFQTDFRPETVEEQQPVGFVPPPNQYGSIGNKPSMTTLNISNPPPSYAPKQSYPPDPPRISVITQQPMPSFVYSKRCPIRVTHLGTTFCVICLCISCPCCWVSYCINCSRDAFHEFINRSKHIGTYKAPSY